MVVDLMQNAAKYSPLGEDIQQALMFLKDRSDCEPENGDRVPVTPNIIAVYASYVTKPQEECAGEIHRYTMDIHYIVTGGEYIGFAASGWEPGGNYDAQTDTMPIKGAMSKIRATAGMFVIFDVSEAHQPGVSCPEFGFVQKIIMKIKRQGAE